MALVCKVRYKNATTSLILPLKLEMTPGYHSPLWRPNAMQQQKVCQAVITVITVIERLDVIGKSVYSRVGTHKWKFTPESGQNVGENVVHIVF